MLDLKPGRLAALFLLILLAFASADAYAKQRPYGGGMSVDWYKADGTERTRFDDTRFVVGFALVNTLRPTMAGCVGVVMGDVGDKIKAKKFRVNSGVQFSSSVREEFPRQTVNYQRRTDIEDQLGLIIPNFTYQIHSAYAPFDRFRSGETIDQVIDSIGTGGVFHDAVIDNKLTLRNGNKYGGGCKIGSFPEHEVLGAGAAREAFERELIYDVLQQMIPGFLRPQQDEGPRRR